MSNVGFKNVYVCQECKGRIVTIDIDEGTTPFMILCKANKRCRGFMYSQFYRVDQTLQHEYEWFRPKSFDGYSYEMREHLEKGGLDIRPRAATAAEALEQEGLFKEADAKLKVHKPRIRRKKKKESPTASNGGPSSAEKP